MRVFILKKDEPLSLWKTRRQDLIVIQDHVKPQTRYVDRTWLVVITPKPIMNIYKTFIHMKQE